MQNLHLYIFPQGSNFHSRSFRYLPVFSFLRRDNLKVKKKEKCSDYIQIKRKGLSCFNKWHCIDLCMGKEFVQTNFNISSNIIVNKDFFSSFEW